ncbi:MAG: mechanosensitive ion channel family protein [Myxococcota bacterium]
MSLAMITADLVGAGHALLAQTALAPQDVATTLQQIDFAKIARALVIVAVGYVLNRGIEAAFDSLSRQLPKRRLLFERISSFGRLAIFVLGTYLAVAVLLEDQDKAAVGVVGTLAVALGFALKDTFSSVMAGVLILIDRPFQVGDRIRFGDTYGEVREIGLRTVRVLTLDNHLVSIPNNKFLTDEVASANDGELDMMVAVTFYVAVDEDADLVKKLVYEACVTSRYIFLNKPVKMRVQEGEFGPAFATTVKCKAHIIDARFERSYVTDVTERVKLKFETHDIESPYARLQEVP